MSERIPKPVAAPAAEATPEKSRNANALPQGEITTGAESDVDKRLGVWMRMQLDGTWPKDLGGATPRQIIEQEIKRQNNPEKLGAESSKSKHGGVEVMQFQNDKLPPRDEAIDILRNEISSIQEELDTAKEKSNKPGFRASAEDLIAAKTGYRDLRTEKEPRLEGLRDMWATLGGLEVEAAEKAVGELNFKSDATDRVTAQTRLRDAKDAFYSNLQESRKQPEEKKPYKLIDGRDLKLIDIKDSSLRPAMDLQRPASDNVATRKPASQPRSSNVVATDPYGNKFIVKPDQTPKPTKKEPTLAERHNASRQKAEKKGWLKKTWVKIGLGAAALAGTAGIIFGITQALDNDKAPDKPAAVQVENDASDGIVTKHEVTSDKYPTPFDLMVHEHKGDVGAATAALNQAADSSVGKGELRKEWIPLEYGTDDHGGQLWKLITPEGSTANEDIVPPLADEPNSGIQMAPGVNEADEEEER